MQFSCMPQLINGTRGSLLVRMCRKLRLNLNSKSMELRSVEADVVVMNVLAFGSAHQRSNNEATISSHFVSVSSPAPDVSNLILFGAGMAGGSSHTVVAQYENTVPSIQRRLREGTIPVRRGLRPDLYWRAKSLILTISGSR